jgi:aarF domain-containing kinase
VAHHEHVLPEPFIRNMEPLCQETSSTEYTKIKKIIERELNAKFEDVFDYFEEKPLGSASIAQVHKARLKNSDKYVAVKIQHPRVFEYTVGDIAVGRFASRIAEYLYDVKIQWMLSELQKNMDQELDFEKEAANIIKIGELFKNDKRVVVPTVYTEFSTKRVLVMSFEEGKSIVDAKYRVDNNIKAVEIAELLADLFNRQIFEFGFVHADPHSGNLFVRREMVDGQMMTRLVLLDHGLYCILSKDFIYNYSTLWRGMIKILFLRCVYTEPNSNRRSVHWSRC